VEILVVGYSGSTSKLLAAVNDPSVVVRAFNFNVDST